MHILPLFVLLAAATAPATPSSSIEGMQPAPGVPTLLQSGIPQLPADLKARTGQCLNTRAANLADVSEDGSTLLVSTRFASTVRAVQERNISPLLSVQKIEAELFVQQGYNDPRVPRSEAEQIVKAVRARGKDVWYLLGMNEGHGFAKKENRDYATAATVLFFQRKLLEPVKTN
jgi:fermentation-respiration switch protein FrsA (DUF1100 family)